MKKMMLMAITSLMFAIPAFAQDEVVSDVNLEQMDVLDHDALVNRPGRPGRPGPGRPGPGRPGRPGQPDRGGYCTVTFKSCRVQVGGFCVKWKSRQFNVNRWDARDGCWIAERRYGQIRSCRVHCNR